MGLYFAGNTIIKVVCIILWPETVGERGIYFQAFAAYARVFHSWLEVTIDDIGRE